MREGDCGRGEAVAGEVDDDADAVHAPPSRDIGDAAEAQREAGHEDAADDRHPLYGRQADVELALNAGQRDVGAVEVARSEEGAEAEDAEEADLLASHTL